MIEIPVSSKYMKAQNYVRLEFRNAAVFSIGIRLRTTSRQQEIHVFLTAASQYETYDYKEFPRESRFD